MKKLKQLTKLISVFCLNILLISCSLDINSNRPKNVTYIDKNDSIWLQHLAQLEKIQQYKATGQLGYISKKERFSSNFEWIYNNPKSYSLLISSTLSRSTLLLKMENDRITVSDNKGNHRSEKNANLLLKDIIGMDIPLDKLTLWLKGQVEKEIEYNVGTNHLLANINYLSNNTLWSIDYLNYHSSLSLPMPKDILLKNKDQTLKIRIENWRY